MGIDHLDVAERLEPYAELLMKTDHASEAAWLLARTDQVAQDRRAAQNRHRAQPALGRGGLMVIHAALAASLRSASPRYPRPGMDPTSPREQDLAAR